MYNPVSTYRLQFNKDFTFNDAEALVEYFAELGIVTLYASPIFAAVRGSTHGYDVINPYLINPEIGTEEQLRRLIGKLQQHGIGWIQDIVPNHMAYHTDNPWLLDVLEKGALSPYAKVFDFSWSNELHAARPMVPFLGKTLEDTIAAGELSVRYHGTRLNLHASDMYFPLHPRSYGAVLSGQSLPASIEALLNQVEELHQITDPIQYALRWHEMLLQLASITEGPAIKDLFSKALNSINSDPTRLRKLADSQPYRLCHWRETDEKINYRRFFLVNGLICLNMQDEKVFAMYHERIATFVKEGLFQGLRVDHIDGLLDPAKYLSRLRELCGPECYIVVEKILEHGELLDARWPIQGTTGYDFLGAVNNLFTRSSAENRLSKFYRTLTRDDRPVPERILEKKQYILEHHMRGELKNLVTYFQTHLTPAENEPDLHIKNVTVVSEGIKLLLVELPVYRFYGNHLPLDKNERTALMSVLENCKTKRPDLSSFFTHVSDQLGNDQGASFEWLHFYQRCMQFTGPLMAKGVEDTLMYTYNRFVGHNEVGDSPEFFGLTTKEFHALMQQRQRYWPLTMNATSTHDTKRGEDVRMRLNVLPDLADQWIAQVKQWMDLNRPLKIDDAPDENDEYFIYQNLIGVYPHGEPDDLLDRMKAFMTKAVREAKRHSDWGEPNEAYESAVAHFLEEILAADSDFLKVFVPFSRRISDFGMINSLSQLVLKTTCPGVPDTYQGTTNWDLSLVDPDNRRPVDFNREQEHLRNRSSFRDEWKDRDRGKIKGWLLQQLLRFRKSHEPVFSKGQYVPLEVEGRRAEHCVAYARQLKKSWVVVVLPLNIARFTEAADNWSAHWENTTVLLPAHAPQRGHSMFSEAPVEHRGSLKVSELLKEYPVALLHFEEENSKREAGIVLAISSLPGPYGVGDLGTEARNFADFLHRSRQRVWQLLPINPAQTHAFSPYSAYSAMAGSLVYISPDDLADAGLIDRGLCEVELNRTTADYQQALRLKTFLLRHAYQTFKRGERGEFAALAQAFARFTERESYWLTDFALFEVLREKHQHAPWMLWPESLRDRHSSALAAVLEDHADEIEWYKWTQFIFDTQWRQLKDYCQQRDIKLLGDVPFYMDHNSADVWAHRELFALHDDGSMAGVAGVPPDYFSEDGQLWGMPVYNWEAMRGQDYGWFVRRLNRQLEQFDMLRLDHFRAFASYWEVPAGASTAKGGSWKNGPGAALFSALRKSRDNHPFVLIAEDLGEITEDVYALRDELQMPGMYVLQFAFDDHVGSNLHSPHRHTEKGVVYTGTHDNNTTRGWFRKELTAARRATLEQYAGKKISASNVASTLIHMTYASVANMAIVPLQDILDLNEPARLNTPGTVNTRNWRWRLREIPDEDEAERLCHLTRLFGR